MIVLHVVGKKYYVSYLMIIFKHLLRTAVAQWLRFCVTNRKIAGSIPDGVIGIFH